MGGIFGIMPPGKSGWWNGKYWEIDEGSVLVHEKGLEMVRNIYDDLLKTADYRERIDIEKAAIMSESVRRRLYNT